MPIIQLMNHEKFIDIIMDLDENYLDMVVKAELNKKIGNITTPQPNIQNTS